MVRNKNTAKNEVSDPCGICEAARRKQKHCAIKSDWQGSEVVLACPARDKGNQ